MYFDAKSFLLVPKNAFNDLETMQRFRALLKSKL
ncbi:hypothetical protein LWM68_34760 [Niabella sp. W65]|nr:hypothetical protein [Niabella sp. W65]MCH7367471.1 hypothetical protein [Niabella sp. W65]ULT46137.1 hypothetical protein KRR40_09255 [Niabella sp. I65]